MKKILIFLILLFCTNAYGGGTTLKIKVIDFEIIGKNECILNFSKMENSINTKPITLIIKYHCNSSLYSCLTRKRTFTKKQHEMAFEYLSKIAIPGNTISIGLMGSGYYVKPNAQNQWYSSGLFLNNSVVYTYENPFL